MPPELDRLRSQFEDIRDQARELTAGLSDAQFTWRPAPRRWSIGDCLAHLILTGEAGRQGILDALTDPRYAGPATVSPARYGWVERLLIRLTEPPPLVRVPAPSIFHAPPGQPVDVVVPAFLALQEGLLDCVELSRGRDLARVKVLTPITRWRRFSLGAVLTQLAAHERRHLFQARNVRDRIGFPA